LKFTLALLHRLGSEMNIRTPEMNLKSIVQEATVRDTSHRFMFLEEFGDGDLYRPASIPTHITETAGADTWTEPWFALRELVQNALDEEGGQYFESESADCDPSEQVRAHFHSAHAASPGSLG
jgi:hypothetical protein